MVRTMTGAVVVALSLCGAAMAGEINGNTNYQRHDGGFWVNGDMITRSIQANVSVQAAANPKPGNLGTFQVTFSAWGNYLGNASQEDINFQKEHPYQANGSRTLNRAYPTDSPWGPYYQFDPKLQVYWNTNASIWVDTGDGKGGIGSELPTPPPVPMTIGNLNAWFSVTGGSVTSSSFYLNTTEFVGGNPGYMTDWNAGATFSGIIEAATFTVKGTPEPASLGLLALGSISFLPRRRRSL